VRNLALPSSPRVTQQAPGSGPADDPAQVHTAAGIQAGDAQRLGATMEW